MPTADGAPALTPVLLVPHLDQTPAAALTTPSFTLTALTTLPPPLPLLPLVHPHQVDLPLPLPPLPAQSLFLSLPPLSLLLLPSFRQHFFFRII